MDYFMTKLSPGEILWCRVTRLECFGAFVDIGRGIPSFIGIENISVSRIRHPADRFRLGQLIPAVVTEIDRVLNRVSLSHKELLGTWEENAAFFNAGDTVEGDCARARTLRRVHRAFPKPLRACGTARRPA